MLKLTQELKLTQKLDVRMIQSLKLLPLTTMQLEQRINQELEQNPMLQVDETVEKEEEPAKEVDRSGQVKTSSMEETGDGDFTEAEWLKYFEDGYDYQHGARGEYDPNVEELEPTYTYSQTLSEYLAEQLGMTVRDEETRELGEFIIGCINDDGFLEMPDEAIADDLGIPVEDVRKMISVIQQFDPPGVGARDLRECLLIQLEDKGLRDSTAWEIVHDHFEDFKNRKYKEIMKNLGIPEEDLKRAVEIIGRLNPRPGSLFKDVSGNTVIPDIIVEKIDGEYEVMLNERNVPRLTISPSYRRLLEKGTDTSPETRRYLVEKLNGARWFINSIEQRRTTILRVSRAIVERQKEFLEHGVSHLRPMTLQDIADDVGVAVSTVQRVTAGKYIQTPQGVFELKSLFTQRIASSNGSEDFSAKSVKERLKRLIEEEDPHKPLSDQKITDILNKEGIAISRRAIAKYRDELQIPPARLRKRL